MPKAFIGYRVIRRRTVGIARRVQPVDTVAGVARRLAMCAALERGAMAIGAVMSSVRRRIGVGDRL